MPDSRETGPSASGAHDTISDIAPVRRSFQLERGSSVGRYVVIEPIGSGGMSVVYAAYDPELDRRVALKVLRGPGDGDSPLVARERMRLLREAQAMARLTHPNVMPIYDAGSIDERVFLAMHYVEGQTLTQWLAQPRGWRQIVEFFVYAGRGLAAAHAAGLVHRDFKPDNVLVDGDGRVRVTDFGLARPSEAPRSTDEPAERAMGSAAVSGTRLERPVTIAGAVLGTPAYMSPEQHLAQEVDARTDQFSFCVALWEALVGTRPFAGDTVGELAFAVTRGQMRSFPRDSAVPGRIRRALERGLSRSPAERFASMDALLGALAPPIRRRPALWLGAAATLVAAGAMLPLFVGDRDAAVDPCATARAGLDDLYDGGVRERVVAAITSTGGLSDELITSLADTLERNAADWRASATEACVAHHVDGVESAEAFDARMRCLGRRRAEFEDALDDLLTSDAERVVPVASAIFDGISPLECNDARRLLEARPPPDDPALRAQADDIDDALDALEGAVETDDATVDAANRLVRDAEAIGWQRLTARAYAVKALIHEARGEIGEAELAMREGARHAAAGRDDAQMLTMLGDLAYSLAYLQNRIPAALEIAYVIELEIVRVDGHPRVAGIFNALGAVYQAANELERASHAYRRGLAIMATETRDNPIRRAIALNNLGTISLTQGDALTARGFFEQALALARATHGDGFVRLSDNYTNLCESYVMRGEYDLAQPHCDRALAIVDGPRLRDAAAAARALHSLAALAVVTGDFAAARDGVTRARPLMISTFGADSIPHLAIEYVDATIRLYEGDLDAAARQIEYVDAKLEVAGPALAAMRLSSLSIRGLLALLDGDPTRALALCDRALADLPAGFPADHPTRLEPMAHRGAALGALGRDDEARAVFEHMLGIYGRAGGDPFLIAHARFGLAKLAAARNDGAQARTLAMAAREDLRLVKRRSPAFVAELDAWLEAHR